MSLKEMWAKIDELAEKERMNTPVWCVWEAQNPDAGYELFRTPTAEEAITKFKNIGGDGWWPEDVAVSCRPATAAQIKEKQSAEASYGKPRGPVSPRLKMEKV